MADDVKRCAELGIQQLTYDFTTANIDDCIRIMERFADRVADAGGVAQRGVAWVFARRIFAARFLHKATQANRVKRFWAALPCSYLVSATLSGYRLRSCACSGLDFERAHLFVRAFDDGLGVHFEPVF